MKKIRFMAFMLMGAAICMPLTSCGDDDDEPGNGGSNNNPVSTTGAHTVYTTLDGKKVTVSKIGGTEFRYNSDNYATKIGDASINYESGKIVYGSNSNATADFKLNGSGYIESLTYKYSVDNDYNKTDNNVTYTFSYDGNGNLTKINKKGKNIYINKSSGSSSTSEWTDILTLQWREGYVINAESDYEESNSSETGQKTTSNRHTNYAVNYDGKANEIGQYTMSYATWFDSTIAELSLVGLAGKAYTQLPMQLIATYTGYNADGTADEGGFTYDITYTIDASGKIQTEKIDNSNYIYSYNNISQLDN